MPIGLPEWNNKEQHVQAGILPAQFVAAQGVLICAGPPSAESEDGDFSVTSIGLVENALINQAKALQRIYEIGSSLPYIIPGQVAVSMQLARIFVHGISLMGSLYEYYMQTEESTGVKNPFIRDTEGNLVEPYSIPHSGTFYSNLSSDFFNQPFGLLFWIMDSQPKNDLPGQTVSIFYAEHCFASSHQERALNYTKDSLGVDWVWENVKKDAVGKPLKTLNSKGEKNENDRHRSYPRRVGRTRKENPC